MIKFILIVSGIVIAAIVACKPYWLSGNNFLEQFVDYQVLALMSVILTVTLASVANINSSINRMVADHFKGNEALKKSANKVKREIKENTLYIFGGFILTIIVLLIKGLNMGNDVIVASVNGTVVWVLILFIACMYDIYSVAFEIDDLEMETGFSPEKKSSPKKISTKTISTKKVSKKSPQKSKTKVPTP